MTMPKHQREATTLVRLWAKRLGIDTSWHIDVTFLSKLKGNTIAQINWPDGYQSANLQISERAWAEATDDAKSRACGHELRHLVLAPVTEVLAKYVGYETLVYKAVNDALEKIHDHDTGVIAKAYKRRGT